MDARPAGRFKGVDAEPRPGLRKGKIPGSTNLPFKDLLNADGTFKSPAELEAAFRAAGVDPKDASKRVVVTCGSGTTAGVLAFALENFFHTPTALYDGAFSEWAQADHPERPVIDEAASRTSKL